MDKIKKALDVLKSDCKNPLIIKDMIGVLERELKLLEDSFDASCNHNAELAEENDLLKKSICIFIREELGSMNIENDEKAIEFMTAYANT